MRKSLLLAGVALLVAVTAYVHGPQVLAATSPLNCNLSAYQGTGGLNAAVTGDSLAVTWDGDRNQELRLRFVIDNGTPTIADLAARRKGGAWGMLATNVTPEFRVVSGRRRMDREAEEGLRENGITEITPEVFEKNQWDPFWDAPLFVPGGTANRHARRSALPRKPEEVHRAHRDVQGDGCEVKTDKTHLTVSFPGVTLGVFAGPAAVHRLQGQQPDSQEVVAKTDADSVAYKYDAGLKGLAIADGRLAWRDRSNARGRTTVRRRDATSSEAPLKTRNRLLIAERGKAGSIAAFPPPHNFFLARESRRTSATTGTARTATARSRSASARPRKTRSTRNTRGTSRSTARGPGRCSTCRCTSTSAPSPPTRRATRCSPSRTAITTSRSPATRRWSITTT